MTATPSDARFDELAVGYALADPDRVTVYARERRVIQGREFRFRVIGSSHLVTAPALEFVEVASCDPAAVPDGHLIALEEAAATTLTYEGDRAACRTRIAVEPLAAFPAGETFDLAHEFAERAVTAIDVGPRGYETWHTYPEVDAAVYTETEFDRLG